MTPAELVKTHPHIFALGSDGVLEMYCDHHILSTLRVCEAKFYEEQLAHIGTKSSRYFSLEFGIWLHECLERYYEAFKTTGLPPPLDDWLKESLTLWDKTDMDFFKPSLGTLTADMRGDQKKYYDMCKWDTKTSIAKLNRSHRPTGGQWE